MREFGGVGGGDGEGEFALEEGDVGAGGVGDEVVLGGGLEC